MAGTVAADLPSYPFRGSDGPFVPLAAGDAAQLTGPVTAVRLPTGGWAWLVTRHADVRQVLRDNAFSADIYRPGFPLVRAVPPSSDRRGMFIRMDGVEHSRIRRMLTAEFMIRSIRRIEPLIQRTVDDALDAMSAAGPPADLVTAFALPVPSMVICHLLGVPYADHAFFQARSGTLLDQEAQPDQIRAAAIELRQYLWELVGAKLGARGEPEDLLGRLVVERVRAGELEPAEVVGIALLLLIAGHETTANMLGLSTLLLLQHPARFAALRTDPDTAPDLVEELLRYLTIVRTGLPRLALADVEVGGQRIQAGEGVIAMLSLANRDGAVFAEPDAFDPDQDTHQHLAFGFGVHQCIGQPLARAELRIALVALATRLPGLRATVAPAEVPTRRTSSVFGLGELPVTW